MSSGFIGSDFVEKLKSANDIVSIISKHSGLRLEKKGKNYWACCPFHGENKPSFCINEYEQFYHCFGCGESGDVITFLRKYEGLDYVEAVRVLAESAGMQIPKFGDNQKYIKAKKNKERCLQILNLAKEFYKSNLYKSTAKPAQDYIKKRGLGKKALENFELGYSENSFNIVNFLKEKGFSEQDLKISGVCEISKAGKPYDFLTGRLIFPIVNSRDECIGFSGRDLKGSDMMKYKNSPSTPVFDKSKAIYAINLVKKFKQTQNIASLENIILVEGQFDVIAMHNAGFGNTVACLGTAITAEHIRELKRYSDVVTLCLDGDNAGQKATLRTIENLKNSDLTIKVVVLPDKVDPDDFLKKYGSSELQKLIDDAISPTEFKILYLKQNYDFSKPDEKSKFLKESLKIIANLNSVSEQEIYLTKIRQMTDLSMPIDVLRRDLQNEISRSKRNASPPISRYKGNQRKGEVQKYSQNSPAKQTGNKRAIEKAQTFITASCLHHKDYACISSQICEYITNPDYKKILTQILEKEKNNQKFLVATVFDLFDVENQKHIKDLIGFNFDIIENQKLYYDECLTMLINSSLEFKKSALSKQYSIEQDAEKRKQILNEISQIEKTIKVNEKETDN
ncbi:MAG: DNA primase [Clostridia bacterium]|jgi:DNA primase|nr:DNA primase [Clostridia bacterium]MDD3232068.1 DNA primase [Clostridia bacterium]MDD3862839.1 DNA primase [Clostridia bacterium]MDD4408346.1 DNA primase [Clostridia bacterium]